MIEGHIDKLVYLRNQEGLFKVSLIQICEVHANPPYSSLLLDYHGVGLPV